MSSQDQVRRYSRARSRKLVLDVDLNALPPCESQGHEGTSLRTRSQDRQAAQGGSMQPPAIDLETYDDDVVVSSPTAFAQAKNNSRRARGCPLVVDVDSEERSIRNKHRRVPTNQAVINCELYINLEGSSNSVTVGGQRATALPPVIQAPSKELTFSCPVCMGPLVEETSTKCGHIFCKACIRTAIATQSKCPTCRRKTTAKDLIRIYLPASGSA